MPDPLTEDGQPNPAYGRDYMAAARALGKAVWEVFGPRVSPDFIVERTDQSTLHFSTFLLRDFNEQDDMPCGYVLARGPSNLSILGSHMYRSSQAREVVRLLARKAAGDGAGGPGGDRPGRAAGDPAENARRADGQAQGRGAGAGRPRRAAASRLSRTAISAST
ncbi:MAG: hypothetical protein MZV70_28700 [Desulfobacterales bacterium]|nr:hypothetical protein [Desulfobacterales bacterium]